MSFFRSISLASLLCCGALLAMPTHAALVTYDFSAAISSGTLAGNTYSGYFSYDASSVTPGASSSATGLLTDLNFQFGSNTYTEIEANTGALGWDAAGELTMVMFGNNCFAGTCVVSNGSGQWVFRYLAGNTNIQDFTYSQISDTDIYSSRPGTVISERVTNVPEPESLALLLVGMAGLAVCRRRSPEAGVQGSSVPALHPTMAHSGRGATLHKASHVFRLAGLLHFRYRVRLLVPTIF